MFTIMLSTPDAVLDVITVPDPNELDALRQTILLGLDVAADAGLPVDSARTLARLLRDHV